MKLSYVIAMLIIIISIALFLYWIHKGSDNGSKSDSDDPHNSNKDDNGQNYLPPDLDKRNAEKYFDVLAQRVGISKARDVFMKVGLTPPK